MHLQIGEESCDGSDQGVDQELEALAAECGLPHAHSMTKDKENKMAVSTGRLMQHFRRYYNQNLSRSENVARIPQSSTSSSEEDEDELVTFMRQQGPTPNHCIFREQLGKSTDSSCLRKWANFVHQLMLAGNIVPDKIYKMRLPQLDTPLDGVDLGIQMRLLRRHANYKMLRRGALPGGKAARWLQRLYRPRVPKLVGVWYNMSAGKWPIAERRTPDHCVMQEQQEDQVEPTASDFMVPDAYVFSSYTCRGSDAGVAGGCAVIGRPDGTGIEQLRLAVDVHVRTLASGATHAQSTGRRGAVTWNVLPATIARAVANYMQNEAHLSQVMRQAACSCPIVAPPMLRPQRVAKGCLVMESGSGRCRRQGRDSRDPGPVTYAPWIEREYGYECDRRRSRIRQAVRGQAGRTAETRGAGRSRKGAA